MGKNDDTYLISRVFATHLLEKKVEGVIVGPGFILIRYSQNPDSPVHRCPPSGSGVLPCCGKTPFEVINDRMTLFADLVTCKGDNNER